LRGRTHKQRLRLRVFANRMAGDELEYLTVRTELENVGLARVRIFPGPSIIKTFADQIPGRVTIPWVPAWEELTQSELVEYLDQRGPKPKEHWVEPGEH